jgi:hypothetical protein
MFRKCGVKKHMMGLRPFLPAYDGLGPMSAASGQKKAPMWKHRDFGIWI